MNARYNGPPLPPGRFVPIDPQRPHGVGWIEAENGCHIWAGARDAKDYGKVWDSERGKLVMAHRLRYEREVGPIPDGLVLDHFVCDTPPCCNPHHCRPASQRENILRGTAFSSDNAAKTHCQQGHPLEGENLYASHKRRGARVCRTCLVAQRRKRENPAGNLRNQDKTHCPQGHPLNVDNLVASYLKKGVRRCLTCTRAHYRTANRRRRCSMADGGA